MKGEGFSRVSFGQQGAGKFSGIMGESYRLSFPWWPGLIDPETNLIIEGGGSNFDEMAPEFRRSGETIYVQGVGHVQDPTGEIAKILGLSPKSRFGTIVIRWPTNKKGVVDKDRLSRGQYKVMSWAFNQRRFNDIGRAHNTNSLGYSDIIAKCVNQNYQYFDLSASGINLLREIKHGKPNLYAEIENVVAEAAESIYDSIAKTLTQDQIEHLRRRQ